MKEQENIEENCKAQLADLRSKSIESELHEALKTIEKSLSDKEYILGAFLDIERAFNNVMTGSIRNILKELGVEALIVNLVIKMLESRVQ